MQKLIGYALVFVVVAMVLGFGALILQETQSQIDEVAGNSVSIAHNVTGQGLTGLNTFGSWLPILAIVIVAGMVISLLLASFYVGGAYFGNGGRA